MKRLIGLIAIAVALSFVPVSVGWAAPGHPNAQERKEHPKKAVKKPDRHKHAVKARTHDRTHIRSSGHRTKGPGKPAVKAPAARHARGKANSDGHHPRRIAAGKVKPPDNHNRAHVRQHEPRHEKLHNRHDTPDTRRFINRHSPHDTPDSRRFITRHDRRQHWPHQDNWHRRFRDWSWFGTHRAHNFDACYNRHGRPVYISYEPLEDDYLYLLESRYGSCHYRERHHHHGAYGWCHYWFAGENIIVFFIGDDGYSRAFIWQRDEVESQAVALGILTPDLQLVYSRYEGAMPPDLAAGYTRDVLWATVDAES